MRTNLLARRRYRNQRRMEIPALFERIKHSQRMAVPDWPLEDCLENTDNESIQRLRDRDENARRHQSDDND